MIYIQTKNVNFGLGFTLEELMNVPTGRRRRYHDDVTIMIITLGNDQRTSKASTFV